MGSSWEALAAEGDPQERGIGTLLVEAGAGGGGGGVGVKGGGRGGRGEGAGAGVLTSENNGRIRRQPSLIGRLSWARPTEGLEECAWELYPVSNQSSRAPFTCTMGKVPARSPNPGKCGNEESYGTIQGSAGEGRRVICRMPGGLARSHD